MRIEPSGIGAGVNGLALAQEGDVRAAAADLDEEGVAVLQGRMLGQPLAHRQVGEAVLLGAVDDLDLEARAQAHAVQGRHRRCWLRGRRWWPPRDSGSRRRCP
jgi:hypothetical protein